MAGEKLGQYTGTLVLIPLGDGRRMQTVLKFGFADPDGLHWPVPPGTTVDGASIPRALWTVVGGPWEGLYRDASVVHDYYCSVRSADWQAVHLMFYRAMLASGVSGTRAKVMYAAVYFAGPRWSDMDVANVKLGPPASPTRTQRDNLLLSVRHDPLTMAVSSAIERDGKSAHDWVTSGSVMADKNSEIILRLDKLTEIVEQDDPPLTNLVKAINTAVAFIPDVEGSPRDISFGIPTS